MTSNQAHLQKQKKSAGGKQNSMCHIDLIDFPNDVYALTIKNKCGNFIEKVIINK